MTKPIKTKMNHMLSLPTPSNISISWNLGSMMGICLIMQVSSGLVLSMNYCPNINFAFNSIINMTNNMNMGWLTRSLHVNGASMFFIFMYMHILRGMYFSSYKNKLTWSTGILILLTTMMAAFMGYVLPWGSMSFWGATVITNLISAVPYLGQIMVELIWGGMAINNSTLNRFYSIHFILPFLIMLLASMHLTTLHWSGSSNPTGLNSHLYMIPFHPYFTLKDYVGFMSLFIMTLTMCTQYPIMLMDPDNFIKANPLITPPHIKPEWYFLFAYSILRSISNKLGGVLCLISSILILMILIMYTPPPKTP